MSLPTTVADFFGPGYSELYLQMPPTQIFAVNSGNPGQEKLHDKYPEQNVSTIVTNLHNPRSAWKYISDSIPRGSVHILTATPVGPFLRFMESGLRSFPVELVWGNYALMYKMAYNLCSNDRGVMLFQTPEINSNSIFNNKLARSLFINHLSEQGVMVVAGTNSIITIKTKESPVHISSHLKQATWE